jgi:TonB family protein
VLDVSQIGSGPALPAGAKPAVSEFDPPPALGAPGGVLAVSRPLEGILGSPHPQSLPVEMTYTTTRRLGFGEMLHKITRSREAEVSDDFVPPKAVRTVPPYVASRDGEAGTVDVKVFVDENGDVLRAQVLTKHTLLAGPSLDAARQWHFTPARKRDKPVPTEVVLHFRFGPKS